VKEPLPTDDFGDRMETSEGVLGLFPEAIPFEEPKRYFSLGTPFDTM
jgi:hypothetical protein